MTAIEMVPDIADAGSAIAAQAKVRAIFSFPIMVTVLIYLWYSHSLNDWARVVTIVVSIYTIAMLLWVEHPRLLSAKQILLGTAILDPLMLSAWVSMVGEVGGLAIGFYLFTIIGFGLRTGRSLMLVCQTAAIIGFSAVFATQAFWREHYVVWLSYLVTLILVPLYATVLVKKLHEARGHAERESQAKSQLLAKVSHELRTPLSGIVAAAQLLSAETEDKRVASRAETIMGLSKDLLSEINDLLDQAKYDARALVLDSTLFELRDQMERLRLVLEPVAQKKSLAFVVDVDPRIQDRVQGDSHYLSKVLINLAGNAVKFTEKGKVEIAITLLDKTDDQYRIRFSVQDTGIGIPKEMHAKIFEPFFQADSGTARKYGGTGLGMTIAKEIVNLMGGDIQVDSSPGAGSHFHFDLDFRRVKTPQNIASTDAVPTVCGKRVLVVDDNATNLTLFKELLLRDRHEVVTAQNGADALEALSSRDFDVIFLDFNMEDMDGATVLQIYRFGRIQSAPAFFLTADATAATAAKLRDTGAVGVLHKPISAQELRQAIAQVCGAGPGLPEQFPGVPAQAARHTAAPSPPPLAPVPTQYIDHRVLDGIGSTSERPEFLADVLGSAITDIERNSDALAHALAAQDSARVRAAAHALKGVCSSIGATRLEALANRLMRASAEELVQQGARLNADIVETSRQSVAALRNALPGRAVNG